MALTQNKQTPSKTSSDAEGFNAHLEFFDRDRDQKISLLETKSGLQRLGLGHMISLPATGAIHAGLFALGLAQGKLQNPLYLSMPGVGLLRHPDTALVDKHAEFDFASFDAAFAQYGREYEGEALTLSEISAMASARLLKKTRGIGELLLLPGGAVGTFVEWGALLWLAGERRDGKNILTKDAVRRFYTDPRFFGDVQTRLEQLREQRSRAPSGKLRNVVQTWFL